MRTTADAAIMDSFRTSDILAAISLDTPAWQVLLAFSMGKPVNWLYGEKLRSLLACTVDLVSAHCGADSQSYRSIWGRCRCTLTVRTDE